MRFFDDLFNELHEQRGDTAVPDPAVINAAFEKLASIHVKSEDDDRRRGPPRSRNPVKVVGDPEIVDTNWRYFHFFGTAFLVNLDSRGLVRSFEYVGVRKDNNYIKDVWQYDFKTRKYRYRDLQHMQGVPAHRVRCRRNAEAPYWGDSWTSQGDTEFHVGDPTWKSECGEDAVPPKSFLKKFKPDSETFFVNLQDGTFARGPKFSMLKAVIDDPARFLIPLIMSCSKDPEFWMRDAAAAITKSKPPGKAPPPPYNEQAVQVAQLVLGLRAACVQPAGASSPAKQATDLEDPWMTEDPWAASAAQLKSQGGPRTDAGEVSAAKPTDLDDPWITGDPWMTRDPWKASAAYLTRSEGLSNTEDAGEVSAAKPIDLDGPPIAGDPWAAFSAQPTDPERPLRTANPGWVPAAKSKVSEDQLSRPAAPKPVAPKLAAPKLASPTLAASKLAAPKAALPKPTAPKLPAPQLTAPKPAAPKLAAPMPAAPKPAAPKPAAPKLPAPQLAAPKPAAPKPAAPQRPAPKPAAPNLAAPAAKQAAALVPQDPLAKMPAAEADVSVEMGFAFRGSVAEEQRPWAASAARPADPVAGEPMPLPPGALRLALSVRAPLPPGELLQARAPTPLPPEAPAPAPDDGAPPLLGDRPQAALPTEWQAFRSPDGGGRWWWREAGERWFLESDPGQWERFRDPDSGRTYWYNGGDAEWFFCDTGSRL